MNAKTLLTASLALILGLLLVPTSVAAPQPDPIPQRWQLDLEVGPMRLGSVEVPGVGPRTFAFLTYTVTNYSGQDLLFAPSFELATDQGTLVKGGQDVPASVTREILGRLDNPLILDQIRVLGTLQQGEENQRTGLVVFPFDDLDADEAAVYLSGFSGETDTVEFEDPMTGEPKRILFRKTYQVRYALPGDINPYKSDPLMVKGIPGWIMR